MLLYLEGKDSPRPCSSDADEKPFTTWLNKMKRCADFLRPSVPPPRLSSCRQHLTLYRIKIIGN